MSAIPDSVPRETRERLGILVDLVTHWNKTINLISEGDASGLWHRHVADSVQLAQLAPAGANSWLDLGSGAGFPGLVCAAVLQDRRRSTRFTLVEADRRKAAFLREASRAMSLDVDVIERRIEAVTLPAQDVISARALAALPRLLDYACRFVHQGTVMIFPKGRMADSELTLARRDWHIRVIRVPSLTAPDATILRLSEVSRRR